MSNLTGVEISHKTDTQFKNDNKEQLKTDAQVSAGVAPILGEFGKWFSTLASTYKTFVIIGGIVILGVVVAIAIFGVKFFKSLFGSPDALKAVESIAKQGLAKLRDINNNVFLNKKDIQKIDNIMNNELKHLLNNSGNGLIQESTLNILRNGKI